MISAQFSIRYAPCSHFTIPIRCFERARARPLARLCVSHILSFRLCNFVSSYGILFPLFRWKVIDCAHWHWHKHTNGPITHSQIYYLTLVAAYKWDQIKVKQGRAKQSEAVGIQFNAFLYFFLYWNKHYNFSSSTTVFKLRCWKLNWNEKVCINREKSIERNKVLTEENKNTTSAHKHNSQRLPDIKT